MQCGALRPANPNPREDIFEVFEGNPALRAFGLRHDAFADMVIHVAGETRLALVTLLEKPSRRLRTLGLQLRSQAAMPMPQAIDLRAGVNRAVAISENIHHAEVKAKDALHVARFRCFDVAGSQQVELPVNEGEVGFSLLRLEQDSLTLTADERDGLTASHSPDRNFGGGQFPPQDAGVVCDGAVRSEGALDAVVEFVGVRDFRLRADDDLRGEAKLCARQMVAGAMDGELPPGLVFPGPVGQPLAKGVSAFHRLAQCLRLFWRRAKLNLCGQFHASSIAQSRVEVNASRGRRFLPALKYGVSAPVGSL